MTQVFDTYSRRTIAYYILWAMAIIPIALWILTNAFSALQLSANDERCLLGSWFFAIAIFIVLRNSFVKMFIVDGELSFSEGYINAGSLSMPLNQIKKIMILANDYKGTQRGTSDGSGNRIEIHDQSDKVSVYHFVIKSYFEQQDLKKTLAQYEKMGINVTSSGL